MNWYFISGYKKKLTAKQSKFYKTGYYYYGTTKDSKAQLGYTLFTGLKFIYTSANIMVFYLDTRNFSLKPHNSFKVPIREVPEVFLKIASNNKWLLYMNELKADGIGYENLL